RDQQRSAHRFLHAVDDLDPVLREAEVDGGLGDERRVERPWARRTAAHEETFELLDTERGEHLVRFLLVQQADDERTQRVAAFFGERGAQRLRSRDVVRAVEEYQRLTTDDLEPSRRLHA